jgi:hypothetical protein
MERPMRPVLSDRKHSSPGPFFLQAWSAWFENRVRAPPATRKPAGDAEDAHRVSHAARPTPIDTGVPRRVSLWRSTFFIYYPRSPHSRLDEDATSFPDREILSKISRPEACEEWEVARASIDFQANRPFRSAPGY